MAKKQKLKKGIIFGIGSIIFLFIFKTYPNLSESLYGQLVYPSFQFIRSSISYIAPFPFIYIVLALFLTYMIRQLYKWYVRRPTVLHFFHKLAAIIGFLIFFFYILWGYNYTRPSLATKMGLTLETPDSAYVISEYRITVAELNKLRMELNVKDSIEWYEIDRNKVLSQVKPELKAFIRTYNYPTAFPTFIEELYPAGILLKLSTSGFYFPYSGEGYLDAGLPDISVPNTIAHELAHVYGVTNEGECNFLAYKTCMGHSDPFIQYSGLMSYYNYAAIVLKDSYPDIYEEEKAQLDSVVIADMRSKYRALSQYKDIFPKARDVIYNNYLKANGVSSGIEDYSQVYILEYAYKSKQKSLD